MEEQLPNCHVVLQSNETDFGPDLDQLVAYEHLIENLMLHKSLDVVSLSCCELLLLVLLLHRSALDLVLSLDELLG